jgi:hypothetical protein
MTVARRGAIDQSVERTSMNYVLEEIDEAALAKVRSDLVTDPRKEEWLLAMDALGSAPQRNWAIDRSVNSYIFSIPTMREQSLDSHFYFYCNREWHEIHLKGVVGNMVHFDDTPPSDPVRRRNLQEQIAAALRQYGRFGTGPSGVGAVSATFLGEQNK